jgi:hypothetical protein
MTGSDHASRAAAPALDDITRDYPRSACAGRSTARRLT